ncbi:unnamed protein product [Rodentolepis nana]|uniref:FAM178 domain-containing protein n=1 Tax=Rodentolepis nana TaxID=102285 RepID=A0A158QHX8_RODNA|nr:unnamed protein product [Rodentolepis nana]
MAEAVKKKDSSVLEKYKNIDSLPVVNDPLPIIASNVEDLKDPLHDVNEHPEKTHNSKVLDVPCEESSAEAEPEESKVSIIEPPYIPYSVLSSALTDCNYEAACVETVEQSSAPPLMTSSSFDLPNYEYKLPHCYSLDELKNFYSNQYADILEAYENEFLGEAHWDNFLPSSEEIEDVSFEPFTAVPDSCTEHPLLRLISAYTGNLLLWKSTKETLISMSSEISSSEKAIWKIRQQSEILTGKCRDDYEVSYKLEYETAEFDNDQLDRLDFSQSELRKFILDRIYLVSYRVAISRLEIESYLNQVLKQCPSYENFAFNEPVILLPNASLDVDLDRQIKLLRSITSVLFTCLKQFAFIDAGNNKECVPHFELIDNIIEWIMCVTGRFVRQCRLQDHVFIAMHLLRVPFSVSYTPRSSDFPPLCALLQPPALDIASFRVKGHVLDLLSEPELAVRGALLSLCLKNPKQRFNFKLCPTSDVMKIDTKTMKHSWTVVDSDGESDAECSISSIVNLRKSSTQCFQALKIDTDPEFASVESVTTLIDQIDMLGLIDFVVSHCEGTGSRNDHISLLAFANWLVTTLEQSIDFLHRPTSEHPRFQRQIIKRIVEMINALLSGLRLLIERSISALPSSTQSSTYPNLHSKDLTDFKIVLAQYDELCLRVTNFILSSATSMVTQLTCWRRFSRTLPFKLFSSRSKLKFYGLLLSSISPDIEDTYFSDILSQRKEDSSLGVDETVIEEDTKAGEVIELLRAGLMDKGCLAEPLLAVLGQLASLECRPPPPIHENEQNQFCLSLDVPSLEKKLVQRILDILFGLCVVPKSQVRNDKCESSIPISTSCGRAQLVSIVSVHPPFAFRYLLDLILAAASQLDTKCIVSTKLSRRPDFESSTDLLFDLVDALPLTLFTPSTGDLETLLSWIGGNSNSEIPPLNSLRCRIARKLLGNFPWEAVNNATGDYLIPPQLQTSVAVGIATVFQKYIVDAYRQPVSGISETLNSYARRVWTKRSSTQRSRRSASISPARILSSNIIQPPLPVEQEAASFYHWAMRLILRFHLEPSTESLTHLLNATEMSKNPLTTFLVLEIQPHDQPRKPLIMDEDSCLALVGLAKSGHFALVIEAFGRLSICHGDVKKHFHPLQPCESFKELVSLLLSADKSVAENSPLQNFLWSKWRQSEVKTGQINNSRGPILEAFLGATLNSCIGSAGEDENQSLLQAVISSTLLSLLKNRLSPNPQAIWMLENLLKTAFWVEKSFPVTSKGSNLPSYWWENPILRILQSSTLKSMVEESSATRPPMTSDDKSMEGVSSLVSQNYSLLASSWSEGLSTLIPSERIRQYIPYFGLSGSEDNDEDLACTISLTLIHNLLRKTSENDAEALWLVSYLIGAECNADNVFGGYSLWENVLDLITWNRATVLTDSTDPENNLLSIFIDGGILQSGASLDQLGRVTRRLPLIQAISVLTVCPLHHPVFFLLLQFAVTHCLLFSRANDRLSTSESESCFPPGFLLLRILQWSRHNITADKITNAQITVLEVLLCRLREALRHWLQRHSQDEDGDPYGLRSSNAISLFRNIISLLTDLQQTASHGISDTIQVSTLVERIKSLDMKSALQSVNLDAITIAIYDQINRWHFLRGIRETLREKSRSPGDKVEKELEQSSTRCPSRQLGPPVIQQCQFDENSIYGPKDLPPHEWNSLILTCLESLKTKASMGKDRDTRLRQLYRKLLDTILPNLYKSTKCHRSEVVECHPYIKIPLISTRVCKGGARIVHEYEVSRLETSMETEVTEVDRNISNLIDEALNSAQDTTTVSCRRSPSELPQHGAIRNNWALAAFRMVTLSQRIVASQKISAGRSRDESGRLVSIFHLLANSTTAVTYAFPPVRGVLLQCIWIISEYLLSSGEYRYDVVLDALTSSPQLLQLLSKLWPRLLETSVQATPESRIKHFTVVYRRLPLIFQQCGAKVAYDLLTKFPTLPGEISANANITTLPNRSPVGFGGAAQLNSLIVEAFLCLTTIREPSIQKDESTKLIEFIRSQIVSYLQFNFPDSIAHLLEKFCNVKSNSAQVELWYLTKASLSIVLSQEDEYSLSTDDMKHFFDKVNKCSITAYSIRDLPSTIKSDMIECLGILIQQLTLKLSRCVELDHLSLQQGLHILVEMVLNSFWTQVIGLTGSPTDEFQRSASEQLFILTANLYRSKESSEPPKLLNAFLDFLMTRLFCNSSKLNGVHLLGQINQVSSKNADPPNLPEGFPWTVWQPATSVIKTLTQFINGLSRSASAPTLSSLSCVLSRVNWCNPKTDISISDHTANIVALVIAVVCCYDAQENQQDSSLSVDYVHHFIKNCCQFLTQHSAFVRLVSANFAQVKSQLKPHTIINTSDPVFSNFFRFLSIASHMGDATQLEESQNTPDIVSQRHAFINLCVDFLLTVAFPGTLNPSSSTESQDVEVVPTVSSEVLSTASRAYLLVMNSVLPTASTAIGHIVNSFSSSSLWKHVFGEKGEPEESKSFFTKLIETEGPVKDFALRILGLLYDVENCCAGESWSPVESHDFQASVSYYVELLRLRSVINSLSSVVDATFIYWMSDNRALDVPMSTVSPLRQRIPGHCRPLLQALLFDLSVSSMSLSAPDEVSKSQALINIGGIVNLIDTCLWALLQANPKKDNASSFPATFETRISKISEMIEFSCKNASEETSSLANCGSWLVPACLSCKKLLPLFVYAKTRWSKIVPLIASSGLYQNQHGGITSMCASDTPAILLADIMHWFAVLNLQPSDVSSESCSASPQLSGLLLLFNLSMRLITSMGEPRNSHAPQEISRASGFLSYLQSLAANWEEHSKPSSAPCAIVDFIKKFTILTQCMLGLMEEWYNNRGSDVTTFAENSEAIRGLERLRKIVGGNSDNCIAENEAVAAVRSILIRLHGCVDVDDLFDSYSLLCQRFWSPLPPVIHYLFSSSSASTS